jgi:hypothetical protein
MEPLIDWRGNEIKIGSVIIYAVSYGSSVTLNEAIVEEIGENSGYEAKYRPHKLIVQPINSHSKGRFKQWVRGGDGERGHFEEKKANRVRLTALERVAVIG